VSRVRLRSLLTALVAVAALTVAGCGGGSHTKTTRTTVTHHPDVRIDGRVAVHPVALRAADGSRIPGLIAVPRSGSVRGCLIWQFGAGSRKEDASRVWRGIAQIGLATFSMDLRGHGARQSKSQPVAAALQSPSAVANIISGSVSDLHRVVDYLDSQPFCRHNIAYAGVSLAGVIGTKFAAEDRRIRTVVLMSTPATLRAAIGTGAILSKMRKQPAKVRAALQILAPFDPLRYVGQIAPRSLLIVSGRQDPVIPFWSAKQLQAAAGRGHSVLDYDGGHDPLAGSAGPQTAGAIASFVLRHVVEPTFGVYATGDGTYWQSSG
jgi:uncharacterized protein